MSDKGARLLVCGSRGYAPVWRIVEELDNLQPIEVIEGECPNSPDEHAKEWAEEAGVHVTRFPADWKRHGRGAGMIRNQRMIDEGEPELCLAFWDGKSPGTLDMIRRCIRAGIEVRVIPGTRSEQGAASDRGQTGPISSGAEE